MLQTCIPAACPGACQLELSQLCSEYMCRTSIIIGWALRNSVCCSSGRTPRPLHPCCSLCQDGAFCELNRFLLAVYLNLALWADSQEGGSPAVEVDSCLQPPRVASATAGQELRSKLPSLIMAGNDEVPHGPAQYAAVRQATGGDGAHSSVVMITVVQQQTRSSIRSR